MDDELAKDLNDVLEPPAEPAPPEPAPLPAPASEPVPILGHTLTVAKVDNPLYPWLVTCTCNFQAHAKTSEQADYWRRSHEGTQRYLMASKGYQTGHN